MRICIAAGGTGGHLLPGLAVGKELRKRGHKVHFIVRSGGTSQEQVAAEGFASSAFRYGGFPREVSPKALLFPVASLVAYLNARRILRREEPDVVLGMGGYITVPAGLAARRRGLPLVIHEQNSRAGLANRLLSRWAAAVATSFPETQGLHGRSPVPTGLPLRQELVPGDAGTARKKLELAPDRFTVLVFGGSQGARALNRLTLAALPGLAAQRDRWQFIHFTGEADQAAVAEAYRAGGWRAFARPYWSDMAAAYAAADFVVARSGANTVMELARLGKRALLVPFPFATDDHQRTNAEFLKARGLADIVLEKDLTPDRFGSILLERSRSTEKQAGDSSIDGAAGRVADLVESMGKGHHEQA